MRQPDYPGTDFPKWVAVDAYFSDRLAPIDDALKTVLENNRAVGMPTHEVSAVQGKFLALLVRMAQSRRVLEIGTLGGYSTICMARALPEDGKIVTIERNPDYAAVAERNFLLADVASRIEKK